MAPRKKSAHLSAVPEGEVPPVSESEAAAAAKTITQAADGGTRRELLVALQSRIATAVQEPNTPARDLAALSRRLIEIAKDIEALDLAEKQEGERGGSAEDEDFDAASV